MTRKDSIALLCILAGFAVAGFLRLNDLSLYTDSTRYVIWGQSLSQGDGWLDATQPDPEAYVVNAPFYPVLLVPVQWIAPGSLMAAKILTLLFGVAAIGMLTMWQKGFLPVRHSLVIAGLFALSPLTLVIFSEALSEAPFFLLLFMILWMREREETRGWTTSESAVVIVLLAILPLLREVSVAFLAAFFIDSLLRKKFRFAATLFVCVALVVGLWTLRNMVWVGVPESSQATNIQFVFEHFVTPTSAPLWQEWLQRIIINVRSYQFELSGMMLAPFPLNLINEPSGAFVGLVGFLNVVKGWTGLLFIPLLAIGLRKDIRVSPTGMLRALFLAAYASIILLYPLQDIRFFLPAVPFVLILLARGAEVAVERVHMFRRPILEGGVAILAVINLYAIVELVNSNHRYTSAVSAHRNGRASFDAVGYYATPWELAGEALSAVTEPSAMIASASKEIVPFVGGRKVLEVNRAVPLPMFESMLREHDVTILLAQQVRSGIRSHEIQLTESGRFRFDTIATTGWLTVYRVQNALRNGLLPAALVASSDSGLPGYLHRARTAILRMQYRDADSMLAIAWSMDPVNAEIAYQRVTSAALGGTLENAVAAQQQLFSTPRSTSYIPPGRVLLTMAQSADAARSLRGSARAEAFYQAGRAAWDLGYPRQAVAFMDSSLATDQEHFETLLWSTHYAYQSGAFGVARQHLATLNRMDPENAVVAGFNRIDQISASLRSTPEREKRGALFLDLSREYEKIGLPQEALDMADRAWLALPVEARVRTAEILDGLGKSVGARKYRDGS